MANGVWEMYKVNQMKGIRGKLQGDNNLEEANESNQWQHGYKGYIQGLLDIYALAQGYKCTCELMHMVWCNAEM
jgi:hypothetical protein